MRKPFMIRLGKKDSLIKAWWTIGSEMDINISKTISYAITYYSKTGEYIKIAKIYIGEKKADSTKKFYLHDKSPAYKWIQMKLEEGESYASVVKRVLRNSIEEVAGKEEEEIISLDVIIQKIENLGKERYLPVNDTQIQYLTKEPEKQAYDEKLEKITEIPKAEYEKYVLPEEDDEEEYDLIKNLLGGNGLNL